MKTFTAVELIKQEKEIKKRCVLFMEWYWLKKHRSSLFSIKAKFKTGALTVEEVYDKYLEEYFKEVIKQ